jgi:uncharacterized protein (DUF1330 family)
MLTRIRPGLVLDLFRRDLPQPLDVINLVRTGRFESYRWYGLLVMPALSLVGGRVQWMGRFEHSVAGERQADKLLIVRYPSHRHFMAMTLNPYYLTINRLREAGVRRFEASFTHASVSGEGLARRRVLVAAHFNSPAGEEALGAVRRILEPVAGELVYATRAVASLGILDPPADTDPNPLTLGELALFAVPDGELPEADLAALAPELAAVTDGFSLQVYRREPRSAYRPSFRPATAASEAAPA